MDAYKILGVPKGATEDQIRRAFRKKAAKHHPDRGGDQWAFEQTRKAYEYLLKENAPEKTSAKPPEKKPFTSPPDFPPKHESSADVPFDFTPPPSRARPIKKKRKSGSLLGIILGGLMAGMLAPLIFYTTNQSLPVLRSKIEALDALAQKEIDSQSNARSPEPRKVIPPARRLAPPNRNHTVPRTGISDNDPSKVEVEPIETPVVTTLDEIKLPSMRPGPRLTGSATIGRKNSSQSFMVDFTIFNDSDSPTRSVSIEVFDPTYLDGDLSSKFGRPIAHKLDLENTLPPSESRQCSFKIENSSLIAKFFLENPDKSLSILVVGHPDQLQLRLEISEFEKSVIKGLNRYRDAMKDLTKVQVDASRPKQLADLKRETEGDAVRLVFPVIDIAPTEKYGFYRINIGRCEHGCSLMEVLSPDFIIDKLSPAKAKLVDKTWKVSISGKLQLRMELAQQHAKLKEVFIQAPPHPFSFAIINPKIQLIDP